MTVLAEDIRAVVERGQCLRKIFSPGDYLMMSPVLILHQFGCDVG